MDRQERDELYPWLQDLTDEQCWKIWLALDSVFDQNSDSLLYSRRKKGCSPYSDDPDQLVSTHDQAIDVVGLSLCGFKPELFEFLEDELELSEEYKLSNWMREFRHSRETAEQERDRYEREDRTTEELARFSMGSVATSTRNCARCWQSQAQEHGSWS